jgi:NADH-quinone oxidoreductase subunit G
MATFSLDGHELPFEPGDTIIQAARRAGIDIPHYCWHPGLSAPANCRMCLVELMPPPGRAPLLLDVLRWDSERQQYVQEKKPKLVPACKQPVSPGMEVKSQSSEHVRRARAAVQELLLLNHPVDCPICDQAGECRLQDYWLEHQGTPKRMPDEIVHKPKAVPFGPTIVYDAERCIVCTRCIRVCEELAKDPVLSIRERGNLTEVVLSPDRRLDHPYSLMTEYVCPVGALTAVDFRFKARVWFLRSARTICPGCATGCNAFLDYDPRSRRVYRHRPRENLAVNRYFMCDEGMLSYRRVHTGRLLEARVGDKPTALDRAIRAAAVRLRGKSPAGLAVVLSPQHSNEDNQALLALAREGLAADQVFIGGRPPGEGDEILRHPDKNPNTAGVMGLFGDERPASFSGFVQAVEGRRVDRALVLGGDVPNQEISGALGRLETLIVIASHQGPLVERAHVALPASTWAECEGTFVNAQGIAQRSERAIRPVEPSLPAFEILRALGQALGLGGEAKSAGAGP